jgi:hypothetical protein
MNQIDNIMALHDAAVEREVEYREAEGQKPVKWVLEWTFDGEETGRRIYDDERHCLLDAEKDGGICRPLVFGDTHPAPAQPVQEPITEEELFDTACSWLDSNGINTLEPDELASLVNSIWVAVKDALHSQHSQHSSR